MKKRNDLNMASACVLSDTAISHQSLANYILGKRLFENPPKVPCVPLRLVVQKDSQGVSSGAHVLHKGTHSQLRTVHGS